MILIKKIKQLIEIYEKGDIIKKKGGAIIETCD